MSVDFAERSKDRDEPTEIVVNKVTIKTTLTRAGFIWQRFVSDEEGKYLLLERSMCYFQTAKAAEESARS